MPNVRILAEDGDEATVTLLTLSKRVADDAFFDILGDLITTRHATVTLADGRRAEVFLLRPKDGFHPLSEQPTLPLRDFQTEAMLMFEMPGRIRVRAGSEAEAHAIIVDVVRNNRPAPPGFSVAIDGDAIDTFNLRLEAAMANGRHNRTLGVRDVQLGPMTERRLLAGASNAGVTAP